MIGRKVEKISQKELLSFEQLLKCYSDISAVA